MSARYLWLSVLFVGPVALAAPPEPRKPNAIAAVVETHFQRWDRDRDGKLSAEEINALVSNPNVVGDEAAAAAALHLFFRDHPKAEPITRAFVFKAAANKLPPERRDLASKAQHFQADFEGFRNHLQKVPRELFVGEAPRLQGISQGSLGDCYFVAMVGAAVASNRERFKQMFHHQKDGSYVLVFLNGRRVRVGRLTDAQIALSSTAGAQGLWLNVLEEGFGQIRFANAPIKGPADAPLDLISRGGDPGRAMALLTGHKHVTLEIAKHPNDPAFVKRLRAAMIAGTRGRLLMSCGTPNRAKLPPGMPTNHAFAVLGFNPASDVVHLWNPWGNTFQPKKGQGGYPIKGGRFDVPFADFVKVFEYFECETNEPVMVVKKK